MNKKIVKTTTIEALMEILASKDGVARQKARKSLTGLGKPAVPTLIRALKNSDADHIRWEAAKTLGAISDDKAIPSLIKALEDNDNDVRWVAAEALRKYKKNAWPKLLRVLIKRGPDSTFLCQGAHHVLRNQREEGFNDLLKSLSKDLGYNSVTESTTVAAYEILKRMKTKT